jgi:hypothetical protein
MTNSPPPNNLTPAEYHELLQGSGIHPQLIALNFCHLERESAYNHLFISESLPRLNTGRVKSSFLKLYRHIDQGGWWCSGLDPLNHWEPMEWGRFKPLNPRRDWQKDKPVKYESPPKTPNRVTYFDAPDCLWNKIAKHYGIKRYDSLLALRLQDRKKPVVFWEWVQSHPEIPVILTEGEKKAAFLLSLGWVAIALPGIWNGRVGTGKSEQLHPDLVPLAQAGRKFIILFDHETKRSTLRAVQLATVRLGKVIQAVGCEVEVARLPGPEKGVDDWGVAHGEKASQLLAVLIADALALSDYERSHRTYTRGLSDKYPPHLQVNVPYLSQVEARHATGGAQHATGGAQHATGGAQHAMPLLPTSGLVVLWSDMGTGKTELLRRWRQAHPNQRFLNNGHRVNLLKNLALRLETEMYSAVGQRDLAKANALSITIDSLYKLNTDALTYGCVFIDEACQYLTHLLHSQTCKEHRAEILEVLEYLVFNAPLAIIADAHMDDITVDFFRAMRPPDEVPFIIKNDWKSGGRTVYWYGGKDSSALVAQVSAALMIGQKVMVVSDSKRFIKKLEQALTVRVDEPEPATSLEKPIGFGTEEKAKPCRGMICRAPTRVWSVHSGNSGSEENVAFIKDITNAVKDLDALLASPSLGTGVDIPDYHFDAVFGAFHAASQTATECAQMLYRYRPKVPMHVWVAPRPPFGYKDTNAAKIKERILQANEVTAFLIRIDRETGQRGAEKDWALEAYCHIQGARNQSINNLREDLRSLLVEMGNEIVSLEATEDDEAREQLKQAALALNQVHFQAVTKAKTITATEYRRRQTQDYLKPEEIFECEKFRLADSYGMEVTEELVERDNGGRLIRRFANLEAILTAPNGTIIDPRTGREYPAPPKIVAERDLTERELLPICTDWSNYSAQWLARFNLGLYGILKHLVAGGEIQATDPELARMTAIARACAAHLKTILGFAIPPNCSPIWLLGMFVDQLGLKLTSRKEGSRGKQVKIHFLTPDELNFALFVLSHRQTKRTLKVQREREYKEKQERYQTTMQVLYALEAIPPSVSTPPQKDNEQPLKMGVNTETCNSILNQHKGGVSQRGRSIVAPNLESAITCDQLEPNDGYHNDLHAYAELLHDCLEYGVEAIRELLKPWTPEKRWGAVILLEQLSEAAGRQLFEMVPHLHEWLDEGAWSDGI